MAASEGRVMKRALTNMMYREDSFPEKMNTIVCITIPKVNRTAKCEKHRTISLMRHVTKLDLKVIMYRIRSWTQLDNQLRKRFSTWGPPNQYRGFGNLRNQSLLMSDNRVPK